MTKKAIHDRNNKYLDLSLEGKWIQLAKVWILDHLPCKESDYFMGVIPKMPTHIVKPGGRGRFEQLALARTALRKCKAIIEDGMIIGIEGEGVTKSETVTSGKVIAKKRSKQKTGKLPLSEQLRQAIDGSELSRYRIAKEAGVAQSTISQFMNGKRSLSLQAIDRIAELLDLELVSSNTTPKN